MSDIAESPIVTPKIVFIVPYRNREQHLHFFTKHMAMVLEDFNQSEFSIYYIHQNDTREFNRGALKNIGFLFIKEKYPDTYKDITLVFNDIDTMPYTKNFLNYETTHGVVKHFFGFRNTLGGIVSITAADFEKVNGFPNFWAWGYEDNMLQKRVLKAGILIDRSQYYNFMDKNIFQIKHGSERHVNRVEYDRFLDNTEEGLDSVFSLQYTIDESSGFVNVNHFTTTHAVTSASNAIYDLRRGNTPFKQTNVSIFNAKPRGGAMMKMQIL
jgi:hypothetical protein